MPLRAGVRRTRIAFRHVACSRRNTSFDARAQPARVGTIVRKRTAFWAGVAHETARRLIHYLCGRLSDFGRAARAVDVKRAFCAHSDFRLCRDLALCNHMSGPAARRCVPTVLVLDNRLCTRVWQSGASQVDTAVFLAESKRGDRSRLGAVDVGRNRSSRRVME